MSGARLKVYGWGRDGDGMTAQEQAFVLGRHREKFGRETFPTAPTPRLEDLILREPRVAPPAALARLLHDRALRSRGSHLRQVLSRLCPRDARPV